ncbi:AAA+ family ATPase [Loktanella agnita]|uniref:AAA+ family ATPase n=1 Tax=Loktanella agnita TaxID=287097 RepID=UPI003987EFA7
MKRIITAIFALGLSLSPATAQEETGDLDEGFSLMEEGAKMLMRGLIAEMEPAMDDMRKSLEDFAPVMGEFAREIGPAFAELLSQVDDFRNYETPEFLPNGDIIIRRSPDAPVWIPDGDLGEIEL